MSTRSLSSTDGPPSIGFRCGKYHVVARLGRGGMAHVHLAVSRGPGGFNKLVVLKRLAAEDDTSKRMFLEEAKLAALLHHPNVVDTYEVAAEGNSYYIAMEYLDGQPLDRIIVDLRRQGRELEAASCARIVADALSGLHYTHELCDYSGKPLNVVHRDISPHNVFLTFDGTVKVLDFGIAKSSAHVNDTDVGVVRGKLAYMAPEQAAGEGVDRRADVYAAGLILWELLTLQRLRQGESPALLVAEALRGEVPRLSLARPSVGPLLAEILSKALARDPKDRFQSALDMREALLGYLTHHPCSSEELSAFMALRFQVARASLQRQIGDCVRHAESAEELVSLDAIEGVSATELAAPSVAGSLPLLEDIARASGPEDITRAIRTGSAALHVPVAPGSAVPQSSARPTKIPRVAWQLPLWLAAAALGAGLALRRGASPPRVAEKKAPVPAVRAAAEVAPAEPLLRIHGSNTIGDELGPRLVEAFLRKRGFEGVTRRPGGAPERVLVVGHASGHARNDSVELEALGSATAFSGLAEHRCDIGMASRRIKPEEARTLEEHGLGDLRSRAGEHVLGLDGIAIITHPNNTLSHVDLSTLGKLFSGEIDDFGRVGGTPGKVHLYARDDSSGTYDTFKHLVLGDRPVSASAQRITSSSDLSRSISVDPLGLGFIGIAYVQGAKPLAISEGSSTAFYPSPFTVATEGYPLSRRLYLYLPVRDVQPLAVDFVNFALSAEGQEVVKASGFVDLAPRVSNADPCEQGCPASYAALVKGAQRVSVDFRFHSASAELDSRAQRDVDRIVSFLGENAGKKLTLLGFSDSRGLPSENLSLSRERAHAVATELAARGVQVARVEAMGSVLPAASNDNEAGRERNRRVELWLQ